MSLPSHIQFDTCENLKEIEKDILYCRHTDELAQTLSQHPKGTPEHQIALDEINKKFHDPLAVVRIPVPCDYLAKMRSL